MTATIGRKVVDYKTNKSGGSVIKGDVLIPDTTNDNAFTTTTTAGYTGGVWIADETIPNNAVGRVVLQGHVTLVNVNAAVTRGNYGSTHTVAKQATDAGAARTAGTFCRFTTGGATPEADIWPVDLLGSSLTNPMTTAEDIIYGGVAGAPARKAKGANGTFLGVTGGALAYRSPIADLTYAGYNTAGGSFKNMNGSYAKKITLASTTLILSIGAYITGNGTNAGGLGCAILSDNAGTPLNVVAHGPGTFDGTNQGLNMFRNTTARWIDLPINAYLAAGDYWIVVYGGNGGAGLQLGYDAASPVDWTNASQYPADQSLTAFAAHATDKHSIRALLLT